MLVELRRATETDLGDISGEAPIAINPANVAVMFGSDENPNQTIIRLGSGKGYKLFGRYAEIKERFGDAVGQMVELTRAVEAGFGEDEGIGMVFPILVNPELLAIVHGDREFSNQSIVKLRDGRGFKVRGSFTEVMAQLEPRAN